mmetsp:Transcript_4143/g.8001  ORF Transcript_4143/g.8001 Transcript_4143/m.8001 type:complete len:80 (+) Transcript_4143:42-281(+)
MWSPCSASPSPPPFSGNCWKAGGGRDEDREGREDGEDGKGEGGSWGAEDEGEERDGRDDDKCDTNGPDQDDAHPSLLDR